MAFVRTTELSTLMAQALNADVKEAYGKSTDPAKQERARILTIDPAKDSLAYINAACTFFYIQAGRMTADLPQWRGEGSRVIKSVDVITAEIRLKPSRQYIAGDKTGYYRLNIPHALPEKWQEAEGYHQKFGNLVMLYVFGDKRQIKINISDEAEGHRAINHLLRLVDPRFLMGDSAQHSYIGRRPKNAKPHRLEGLTGSANRIRIKHPDRTDSTHQL